jgi:hypothetical protein
VCCPTNANSFLTRFAWKGDVTERRFPALWSIIQHAATMFFPHFVGLRVARYARRKRPATNRNFIHCALTSLLFAVI